MSLRMLRERRAALAGGLLLLAVACGRPDVAPAPPAAPAPSGPQGAAPKDAGAAPGMAADSTLRLTPEALRLAGIATEVIRPAPFAVTLSVPATLSPTPETPEEVEARLAYESAEARYARAAADRDRLRKLAGENIVAAKSLQAAEDEFAQARVDKSRAETTLRNLGMDAAGGTAFPRADLWALADLYDAQAPKVKPGARAFIHVESFPGERFAGHVVALSAFLKRQTRTLTARIAVTDPGHRLRPQEPATAEIQIDRRTALSVPATSLVYVGTERMLFVKRGDGFEKVRVKVGAEQAGRAEILQGVAPGDEVVTRGAQLLLGELYKTSIPSEEEPGEGDEDDEEAGP